MFSHRFWWSRTPNEAKSMADTLSDSDSFWRTLERFLNDPHMSGRELAYEIQILCEDIESQSRVNPERDLALGEVRGENDPWEAA